VLDGFHLGFPDVQYDVLVAQVNDSIQQLRDLSNHMTPGGPILQESSSQGGMYSTSKVLMQGLVDLSMLNAASAFGMEMLGAESSDLYWAFDEESGEG